MTDSYSLTSVLSGKVDQKQQAGFPRTALLCGLRSPCTPIQVRSGYLSWLFFSFHSSVLVRLLCVFGRFLIFPSMGQTLQSILESQATLPSERTVLQLACRIVSCLSDMRGSRMLSKGRRCLALFAVITVFLLVSPTAGRSDLHPLQRVRSRGHQR